MTFNKVILKEKRSKKEKNSSNNKSLKSNLSKPKGSCLQVTGMELMAKNWLMGKRATANEMTQRPVPETLLRNRKNIDRFGD